jgi:lysophospholipase L1-like esterase
MRRAVVLLLLAGSLAAVPLAPSAAGPSAVVVGDSLAVGTEPYLPGLLPGWQLRQIAQKSVSTAYGIARLRRLGATLPHYVVVSLGTNDDPRAVERFRAAIRTVLATAGSGRCVVWPNIVRPRTLGATYEGLNRVLSQEARANRRLRVVDWRGLTRLHPAWLREDGVHGTVAGYRGRAAAIARALAACG